MPQDPSNQHLLSDPELWVELYGTQLKRYAYRSLRCVQAAEDVVQETLFSAWCFRDLYSGKGTEKKWLLAILRRKIIDYIRARVRIEHREVKWQDGDRMEGLLDKSGRMNMDQIPVSAEPGHRVETQELLDCIHEGLKQLSSMQAEAFSLREFEGLTASEICESLKISKANLWVLLHRARQHLVEHLLANGLSPPDGERCYAAK